MSSSSLLSTFLLLLFLLASSSFSQISAQQQNIICSTAASTTLTGPQTVESISISYDQNDCTIDIQDITITSSTVININIINPSPTTSLTGAILRIKNVICGQLDTNPNPDLGCINFDWTTKSISFDEITIDNVRYDSPTQMEGMAHPGQDGTHYSQPAAPDITSVAIIKHQDRLGGINGLYTIKNIEQRNLAWESPSLAGRTATFTVFLARAVWSEAQFDGNLPNKFHRIAWGNFAAGTGKLLFENINVQTDESKRLAANQYEITIARWVNVTLDGTGSGVVDDSGSAPPRGTVEFNSCHLIVNNIARLSGGTTSLAVARFYTGIRNLQNLFFNSSSITVGRPVPVDNTNDFFVEGKVWIMLMRQDQGYRHFGNLICTNNSASSNFPNMPSTSDNRLETYLLKFSAGLIGVASNDGNSSPLSIVRVEGTYLKNVFIGAAGAGAKETIETLPVYFSDWSSADPSTALSNLKLIRISDLVVDDDVVCNDHTIYFVRMVFMINCQDIEFSGFTGNFENAVSSVADGDEIEDTRMQIIRFGDPVEEVRGKILIENVHLTVKNQFTGGEKAQDTILVNFDKRVHNLFNTAPANSVTIESDPRQQETGAIIVRNNTMVLHQIKSVLGVNIGFVWFRRTVTEIGGAGIILDGNSIIAPLNLGEFEGDNPTDQDKRFDFNLQFLHFSETTSDCTGTDPFTAPPPSPVCRIETVSQIITVDSKMELAGWIKNKGKDTTDEQFQSRILITTVLFGDGRFVKSVNKIVIENASIIIPSAPSNTQLYVAGENNPLVALSSAVIALGDSSFQAVDLFHVSDCTLSLYQQRIAGPDVISFSTCYFLSSFFKTSTSSSSNGDEVGIRLLRNRISILDDVTATDNEQPDGTVPSFRKQRMIVDTNHLYFRFLVRVVSSSSSSSSPSSTHQLIVQDNSIIFPQTALGLRTNVGSRNQNFFSILHAFDRRSTAALAADTPQETNAIDVLQIINNSIEQTPSPFFDDSYQGDMHKILSVNTVIFGCLFCTATTTPALRLGRSDINNNKIEFSGMKSRVVFDNSFQSQVLFSTRILQANPLFADSTASIYQIVQAQPLSIINNSIIFETTSTRPANLRDPDSSILQGISIVDYPVLNQVRVENNLLKIDAPTLNGEQSTSIVKIGYSATTNKNDYPSSATIEFENWISGNQIVIAPRTNCGFEDADRNQAGACLSIIHFSADRKTKMVDENTILPSTDSYLPSSKQVFHIVNNRLSVDVNSPSTVGSSSPPTLELQETASRKMSLITIENATSMLPPETSLDISSGNVLRLETPILSYIPQVKVSTTSIDDELVTPPMSVFSPTSSSSRVSVFIDPCANSFPRDVLGIFFDRVSQIISDDVVRGCARNLSSKTDTHVPPTKTRTFTWTVSKTITETMTKTITVSSDPSITQSPEKEPEKFKLPIAAASEGSRAALVAMSMLSSPSSALAGRRLFGVATTATCALRVEGRKRSRVGAVSDALNNNDNNNNDNNNPPSSGQTTNEPPSTTTSSSTSPFTTRPSSLAGEDDSSGTLEDEDLEPLLWDSNIFLLSISGYPSNFDTYRGAIVSYIVLIVGWMVVSIVLAVLRSKSSSMRKWMSDWSETRRKRNDTIPHHHNDSDHVEKKHNNKKKKEIEVESFPEALENVKFPSSAYVPAGIFAPAVSSVAGVFAISATHDDFLLMDLILLIVALIFSVLIPCIAVGWVCHKAHTTQQLEIEEQKDKVQQEDDSSFDPTINQKEKVDSCSALAADRWKWFVLPNNEYKESPFINKYGMIFDTLSKPWFAFVDFAVAVLIGIVSGVALLCPDQICCTAVAVSSIIISSVHLFMIVGMRPFLRRFESALLSTCSVITLVLSIMSIIMVKSEDGKLVAEDVAGVTEAGFALGMLSTGIAIFEVAFELVTFFFPEGGSGGTSAASAGGMSIHRHHRSHHQNSKDRKSHHRDRSGKHNSSRYHHPADNILGEEDLLSFAEEMQEKEITTPRRHHNHHHTTDRTRSSPGRVSPQAKSLPSSSPSRSSQHHRRDRERERESSHHHRQSDRDREQPRQRRDQSQRRDRQRSKGDEVVSSSSKFRKEFMKAERERNETDDQLAERLLVSPSRQKASTISPLQQNHYNSHNHHSHRNHSSRESPSSRRLEPPSPFELDDSRKDRHHRSTPRISPPSRSSHRIVSPASSRTPQQESSPRDRHSHRRQRHAHREENENIPRPSSTRSGRHDQHRHHSSRPDDR